MAEGGAGRPVERDLEDFDEAVFTLSFGELNLRQRNDAAVKRKPQRNIPILDSSDEEVLDDSSELTRRPRLELDPDPDLTAEANEILFSILDAASSSESEDDDDDDDEIQATASTEERPCIKLPPKYSGAELEVGAVIPIRFVKPWPSQKPPQVERPTFQLADPSIERQYEEMEEKMANFYTQNWNVIRREELMAEKHDYGVLFYTARDRSTKYKRIKIRRVISTRTTEATRCLRHHVFLVKVAFVEYETKQDIKNARAIHLLDPAFAVLPPRSTSIELEWLTDYKGIELWRRYTRIGEDEFAFEGKLRAKKQPSGKFIVWSDNYPEDKYPLGINGFIVQSIIEEMWQRNFFQLPPAKDEMGFFYVTHADRKGNVLLQFGNFLTNQLTNICNSIPLESYAPLLGKVEFPLKNHYQLYMAPNADGGYYRCRIISSKDGPDKIRIGFIDYGDAAVVSVKDLIKVEDVHPLLALFPTTVAKAHLYNIAKIMDVDALMNQNHILYYDPFMVQVVAEAIPGHSPAEVILRRVVKYQGSESHSQIIENQYIVTRGLAEAIDPSLNYNAIPKYGTHSSISCFSPKLYMGLGNGKLLRREDIPTKVTCYLVGRGNGWRTQGIFFLIPHDRVEKLNELEEQLKTYCTNASKCEDPYASTDTYPAMRPGSFFLTKMPLSCRESYYLRGKYVRIILVKKILNPDGTWRCFWQTYLIDYGLLVVIHAQELISGYPSLLVVPALGVRAMWEDFPDESEAYCERIGSLTKQGAYYEPGYLCPNLLNRTVTVKIVSLTRDELGQSVTIEWDENCVDKVAAPRTSLKKGNGNGTSTTEPQPSTSKASRAAEAPAKDKKKPKQGRGGGGRGKKK